MAITHSPLTIAGKKDKMAFKQNHYIQLKTACCQINGTWMEFCCEEANGSKHGKSSPECYYCNPIMDAL